MTQRPPVLVEPPEEPPVNLVDMKKHLRIDADVTDDDEELTEKIKAATQALDGYSGALGRALITQTWAVSSDYRYCAIRLPLAPIQSATVSYLNVGGETIDVPDNEVILSSDAIGWSVRPVAGGSWPAISTDADALTVTFVAGYGDPADVPSDIRLAIMLAVEMAYDRPDGERFKALQAQYDAIVSRNRRCLL